MRERDVEKTEKATVKNCKLQVKEEKENIRKQN